VDQERRDEEGQENDGGVLQPEFEASPLEQQQRDHDPLKEKLNVIQYRDYGLWLDGLAGLEGQGGG
jgi:hypothetical protein